jgi:serine/threonine protein kinase
VTLHVDNLHVQNNILITQDGQACLGDFGIADTFRDHTYHSHPLEAIRYMAPERLAENLSRTKHLLTESDIYSFAMTSFEVRSSATNYSTT